MAVVVEEVVEEVKEEAPEVKEEATEEAPEAAEVAPEVTSEFTETTVEVENQVITEDASNSTEFAQKEEKEEIIDKVFSLYGLTHLAPFIKVLSSHHRLSLLNDIVREFATLSNEENGVAEGRIYSASKLSENDRKAVERAFKKKLGKEVSLINIVQPSLLGGIKVALEGKVYDGTLRNKLMTLEKELKSN